ncbi:MAG: hypothetical protein K2X94_00150 [Amoebophilaceae bacterium]|nr:hypothetical protein [Amoebophilaceae bacterium]
MALVFDLYPAAFSDAVGHGEALMYRELFNKIYPHQEHVICGYWLPSARFLPNYGASGS